MTGTVRRWLARLLVTAGALVLLAVAVNLTLAAAYRRHADATLERMRLRFIVRAERIPTAEHAAF